MALARTDAGRIRSGRPHLAVVVALALGATEAEGQARDSVAAPPAGHSPGVARTVATVIVFPSMVGAAGGTILQTPEQWPRTAGGYGRRFGDQVGFHVIEYSGKRLLQRATGWRDDDAPCRNRALLALSGCAIVRTFSAVDVRGARHMHVPLVAGVAAATAVSLSWRPERNSTSKSWNFLATRLAIVLGGATSKRLWKEWRHGHPDGAAREGFAGRAARR